MTVTWSELVEALTPEHRAAGLGLVGDQDTVYLTYLARPVVAWDKDDVTPELVKAAANRWSAGRE